MDKFAQAKANAQKVSLIAGKLQDANIPRGAAETLAYQLVTPTAGYYEKAVQKLKSITDNNTKLFADIMNTLNQSVKENRMKITSDFLRTVIRESLEEMGTVEEAATAGGGVYILLDENNFIRGAYINNDRGFKKIKDAVDELKKDGVQIRVYSCPLDSIQEPNEVDMVYDTGGSGRY